MTSFDKLLADHWGSFLRRSQHEDTIIDGQTLDIAAVTAVARFGAIAVLDRKCMGDVYAGSMQIKRSLDNGMVIYGINTGFGGSADTRTDKVFNLQKELIRMLNSGVLPDHMRTGPRTALVNGNIAAFSEALPLVDPGHSLSLPESWVRAAMLVRMNSLIKGHSGIRVSTLETLTHFLEKDIVPEVPLRGSISASGDLSPLSYIAAAMTGSTVARVWYGDRVCEDRALVPASDALEAADISPVTLGPKEGLAIVNGTAVSASVAALATHEMLMQAGICQLLTAMSVEALQGSEESFHPLFADVRPHPGQRESAQSILRFLQGSRLTSSSDEGLRQDRYSIRTASQWIGPCLEDILLASRQILTEINSVTDNPLLDKDRDRILHGGNFQAKAVTSAMEKMRQSCQSLGRLIFAQCTELINPATNFGLPPNLVIDDPSELFLWKGTDIMMSALQSELGFLANPVGSHVQTAEMGNQALNSLALISARYTVDALDILMQMTAAHLVTVCQAIDLRVIHRQFFDRLEEVLETHTRQHFAEILFSGELRKLCHLLFSTMKSTMAENSTMDVRDRIQKTTRSCKLVLLDFLPERSDRAMLMIQQMQSWSDNMAEKAETVYWATVDHYNEDGDASAYLGSGSKHLYRYVRHALGIPFLSLRGDKQRAQQTDRILTEPVNVGSLNSKVYHIMRRGELYSIVAMATMELQGKKRKRDNTEDTSRETR